MIHISEAANSRRNRLIFRCVLEFLLDEGRRLIDRHGGSFTRGVVHLAVAQASRSPDGNIRGGVSVRAIAQSLGLAYETTRRQVAVLESAGLLSRAGDSGVAIAAGAPAPPLAWDLERCEGLRGLIADLKGLGYAFDPGPDAPPRRDEDLAAPLGALLDAFMLRALEAGVAPYGSMLDALIFSGLITTNAGDITYDRELAQKYAWSDSPPPDELRRPVTIAELSERLGLHHETIRRHVVRYVAQGYVARAPGGYLSSMTRQQSPEILQGGQIIVQRFLQLVQAARQMGLDVEAISPNVRAPTRRGATLAT